MFLKSGRILKQKNNEFAYQSTVYPLRFVKDSDFTYLFINTRNKKLFYIRIDQQQKHYRNSER